MTIADKAEWEVLNTTADDWESLETIYRALNLGEGSGGAHMIGPIGQSGPLLETVADSICRLVKTGLLEARMLDAPGQPAADLADLSYVWRAWFRMTALGREVWTASEHARVG